jgi:hypothetical protein
LNAPEKLSRAEVNARASGVENRGKDEVVAMVVVDLSLIHEKIALANPGFREAAPDGGHVLRD